MEEEKIFCFVGYRKAFEKTDRNSNVFFQLQRSGIDCQMLNKYVCYHKIM